MNQSVTNGSIKLRNRAAVQWLSASSVVAAV